MNQNKNLPALLALKPIIAWDVYSGAGTRHRFTAGCSWLTVNSYGKTICRLSGAAAMAELYAVTSHALSHKGSPDFRKQEQEITISGQRIYFSTFKWRCQFNDEPYIPMPEPFLRELNDWLALVCGDLSHQARGAESFYHARCTREKGGYVWLHAANQCDQFVNSLCLSEQMAHHLLKQLLIAASHPGSETIIVGGAYGGRVEINPVVDGYHASINLYIDGQQFCCCTSKQETLLLAADIKRIIDETGEWRC